MAKYLSGRTKRVSQSNLSELRYKYLDVSQTEPNLGDPTLLDVEANLPSGQQYQIISVIGSPGERYWIPRGGGLIPGAITVFDENVIIPNNSGVSSISQLNFEGDAIRAEGYLNLDGSPGIGVTITVFSPGSQGQFIINDNDEFTGISTIFYDTSTQNIGIGTLAPTELLDVNGDIRLRKNIYDWDNQKGLPGYIIVKNSDGFVWTRPESIITAAGGTVGQVQFHGSAGLVDGADIFYYDDLNDRVGIGSTQPNYLLDVLGISSFKGTTYIDNLNVTNLGTFKDLTVNNTTTLKGTVDAEIGASLNDVRIGISGNNKIDTSTGNLILDSSDGKVVIDGDLVVSGITSVGFITATDGYFSGILTALNLDFFNTYITYLNVTGIATINQAVITNLDVSGITTTNFLEVKEVADFNNQANIKNLKVTGIATVDNLQLDGNTISSKSGNLNLNSFSGNIVTDEITEFKNTTESSNTSSGSVIVSGGVGINKNTNIGGKLNVQGEVELATNGGITTTGGDLYIGGDLYVLDDIIKDEFTSRIGRVTEHLEVKDLTVTGLSTFQGLVQVDTGIVPDTDEGAYLGTQLLPFSQAYIGEVQIASGDDNNKITTTSGDLVLDSAGGLVDINDNVDISGTLDVTGATTLDSTLDVTGATTLDSTLDVTGATTLNGNVDLGDTNTDTVTFNARVGTSIIPFAPDTYDLGSSSLRWNNVYANTFAGQFIGNADTATKLETAITITLGEGVNDDIVSIAKTFDGTQNVGFALTLKNVGPGSGNYGDNTGKKFTNFSLDENGRVTGINTVSIVFSDANVATADSLTNSRNIAATGDISWDVDFKGHENVTSIATLANTGVINGTYGSSTTVPVFNVDSKGRLTTVNNIGIDFGTATVAQSNTVRTASNQTNATHYLTFVDSNNTTTAYESLYTDGEITYNPSTNLLNVSSLSAGNLTVSGTSTFNGNVDLGNASSDTVTFTARVDSNIVPSTNNTRNLGSSTLKWNTVYATTFNGQFIGNADTATTSTNLAGGSAGSLPYQTASNTTAFLAEPNIDGRVLTYNNTTNAPQWSDLTNLPGAGYTLDAIDSGNDVILRLSDGSTNDDVTITAGSNITIDPVSASGFTISAASLSDLGGISGIEIRDSGVSQGTNVTKLDFTNDISATVSGDTATISVSVPKTTSDLTNNSGFVTSGDVDNIVAISTFSGDYNDLFNQPSIPSDTGDLTNSVGFVTSGDVDNLVAISTFSGDYNDLSNQPFIPSDTGDLTNSVGFITSGDVGDGTLTLVAGDGITLTNDPTFTANQSSNKSITITGSTTTDASTIRIDEYNNDESCFVLFTDASQFLLPAQGNVKIDSTGDGLGGTNGMYYNPRTCTLSVKYTDTTATRANVSNTTNGASTYLGNSASDIGYFIFSDTSTNNLFRTFYNWRYFNTNYDILLSDVSTGTPHLIPVGDNSRDLGRIGNKWRTVYAGTGTINTSDEREKNSIQMSNLGLDFIKKLNPVSYKFNVSENITEKDEEGNTILIPVAGTRTHYGLISQQVKQALDELNISDFAGWILENKDDPDSSQHLRYTEFIAPMIKAIQEQQELIESQQQEINILKQRLDNSGIP